MYAWRSVQRESTWSRRSPVRFSVNPIIFFSLFWFVFVFLFCLFFFFDTCLYPRGTEPGPHTTQQIGVPDFGVGPLSFDIFLVFFLSSISFLFFAISLSFLSFFSCLQRWVLSVCFRGPFGCVGVASFDLSQLAGTFQVLSYL